MRDAIVYARDVGLGSFTIVSHSFELLSRDRSRVNPIVRRRFERLCRTIAGTPGVSTATYAENPPQPSLRGSGCPVLPGNSLRRSMRLAEQAVGNVLYGA